MSNLSNHVAIISGGLGDIGRAIVRELASHGASVGVSDIVPHDENVSSFLHKLGVRSRYDVIDVSDAAAVAEWVNIVERELGTPTLIIVNAAIVTIAGMRGLTPQQWSRELRVNLDGAFHMAHAAALRLIERKKSGRIVFIGSWAAHAPHPHITAYCVAKAGLRMLCKCMALELAPHDILVNEIAPGFVDAGLSAKVWRDTPGAREKAATRVPTGRLINAAEVARQIPFLCDPENRHMTGSTLLMDGGLSLCIPGQQ